MSATQRIQQGLRALLAFSQNIDDALLTRYLTPQQMTWFKHMSHIEQLHSVRVLRAVLAQDEKTPHDLALAALMHDVGKTRYRLAIWQKSAAVIVRRAAPALYERWSREETISFWRAPYVVAEFHPQWGADILRQTHAPERAIWLVAHHADDAENWAQHPHGALLRRLKCADDTH